MNQNINILFYSNNCETCKSLIKILENEKLIQYFLPVCVDDKLERLPPQIEVVPTMIVKNMNKPLIAEETFEYVKQVKFIKNSQNNFNENNSYKGLVGFTDVELGSHSDSFAFTKDNAPALPQNYLGYKDDEKHTIFTAPEQNKLKDTDQNKLISELIGKRDKQDEQYADISKKNRINSVIKDEQEKIIEQYKEEYAESNKQQKLNQMNNMRNNQQQQHQQQHQQQQQQQQQLQQMKQMQMMYNMMNSNNTFGNK